MVGRAEGCHAGEPGLAEPRPPEGASEEVRKAFSANTAGINDVLELRHISIASSHMADADVDPEYACPICLVSAPCLLRVGCTFVLQEMEAPLNWSSLFKCIRDITMIQWQPASQYSPLHLQGGSCFTISWTAVAMHCIFLQLARPALQLACDSSVVSRSHTYKTIPRTDA